MFGLITMSPKELHRLEVIQKIHDERLSVVQAAELLDLSNKLWRRSYARTAVARGIALQQPIIVSFLGLQFSAPHHKHSPRARQQQTAATDLTFVGHYLTTVKNELG